MIDFPTTIAGARARLFVDALMRWADERPDIVGVVLHGSWARGAARPDSDIDVLVIARDIAGYFAWQDWLADFGKPGDRVTERRDGATALRVWYADGPEVEFVLAEPPALGPGAITSRLRDALGPESVTLHDPEGVVERARREMSS